MNDLLMTRFPFSMSNKNTFSIPSINQFLKEKLSDKHVIIDPFARDAKFGTITNDLNPDTSADYHMKADDFLQMLVNEGIQADVVILDPPYSPRQVKECYNSIGLDVTQKDTQTARTMKRIHELTAQLLKPGGMTISFGWNSQGVGLKRGMKKIEVHLVPHGGQKNDTIITVEVKE